MDTYLADDLLFKQRNPQGAIGKLRPLLTAKVASAYQNDYAGWARYILALAYEMSGDPGKAIQFYWQLWHTYPDSPYTLIIRRKLEPADP